MYFAFDASNLDIQVRKNLKFGANLYGGQFARNGVVTQEGSGGGTGTGVVSAAVLMEPVVPVFNEDGSYAISPVGDPHDSPVAIALERTNENRSQTLQGNFYAELDILEGLTWKSTLGARTGNNRNGYYVPTTLNAGVQVNGEGGINAGQDVNLVTEHYLTFEKNISEIHNLSLLGGYSYQKFRNESWNTSTRDFISDAFEYWNLSAGSATLNPSSSLTESELASYYGRINYRLFDRYLLTFNARYDGSSNFARNHKWAFFPSGAIAWNLAEENFIKAIRGISELKIRGSYGITGNQAISPYQSLARLRSLPSTSINNTIVNAVAPHPNSVANDNLKWESTAQINIGLDLGLFNQRVGFTADYYRMKTSDLLFSFPLPQYSGYNSVIKNIGTTENKGFEMVLSTVNLEGQVRWTTDFNFSLNRNKILELPEGNDIPIGSAPGHMVGIGSTQILREGEPTGQFYGYVYEGVYQQGEEFLEGAGFEKNVGGEKFRDLNMDGKLDADDRTLIGNPNPDFMWGINNTLEYKGFDLNFFIHGVQGNDIYSFLMFELGLLSGLNNATTDALNRWTPSNTNTDVPVANGNRARISSSRYVFDGSFIRFKNISLGYRFPQSILSRLGISYLRPYLSAQNLITLTDYPGFDPEVNYRGSNTNQGLDYGGYPYVSSYTFGIQIKF